MPKQSNRIAAATFIGRSPSPALFESPYHPKKVAARQKQWRQARRNEILESDAAALGFNQRIPAQKAPFNSHHQPLFFNGARYITRDVEAHRGGVWKMFDRRGRRLGTNDGNLSASGTSRLFEIQFKVDRDLPDQSSAIVRGEIRIDGFYEQFETSLEFWSQRQYEQHWLESVTRILDGESSSCLITSVTDPFHANFLFLVADLSP